MERIKLVLPANQESVSLARLTIASVASGMGFSIGDVEDLKVVVSEACINAIGSCTLPEATFDLTYCVGEKELTTTVTDIGMGFEPELVKLPGEGDDASESGFGLFIIKNLMDQVEIVSKRDVGTTITMVKKLSAANHGLINLADPPLPWTKTDDVGIAIA